jgi:hypothetical protein
MSEERMEECFALDIEAGEFPPGLWASAGRLYSCKPHAIQRRVLQFSRRYPPTAD